MRQNGNRKKFVGMGQFISLSLSSSRPILQLQGRRTNRSSTNHFLSSYFPLVQLSGFFPSLFSVHRELK